MTPPGQGTFDPTLQSFHEFRRRLHRGGAWAYLWTPNTGEYYTDKKTGEQVESKRSLWFRADQDIPIPDDWHHANVYYPVHPTDTKGKPWERSRIDTVTVINCVFAEVDGKDMVRPTPAQVDAEFILLQDDAERRVAAGESKKMTPAKTLRRSAYRQAQEKLFLTDIPHYNELARQHVETITPRPSAIAHSGGGWHLYWLLAEPFYLRTDDDRKRAKDLQKAWVGYVGGDEGAKDLARVLRPWGAYNVKTKYAPDYPVVTLHHLDYATEYNIDELVALLPEPEQKPEPAPRPVTVRSTRTSAANETVTRGYTGDREHTDHVYRVMAAYNERHDIVTALLDCGYTPVAPDRLSRPGEPDSKGVAILDGKSYHHSGNDPLFEVCGEHRLSPFDVVVHWDYDGDYERAAGEIGKQLGIYDPAFIDFVIAHELHRAEHADFSQIVPADKHSANGYLTGATDKAVYMNILRIMGERKRIAGVMVGIRRIAEATNSDGVTVAVCGPSTAKRVLDRLNGVLIDYHTALPDAGAPVTVLSLSAPVVSRWDTLYMQWVLECEGVSHLLTTGNKSVFTTGNVQEYLADDAFLSGRSRLVNEQIANNMNALCFAHPHYAEARRAYQAAKERKPADVHELRAMMGGELLTIYNELKQRAEQEFLKSLGTYGLIVLDDVDANPGTTRKEIAERRGLKPSSVGTALRKLEAWALVESEQGFGSAKVYTAVADVWGEVKERTPEAMSYTLGAQRADQQLAQAQQHAKAAVATAENEDAERAARKRLARIENKRFKTVPVIYPNFDPSQVADWIYGESTHADYMGRESQRQEAPEQTAGEPTHDALVELYDLESRRQTGDPDQFTPNDYGRQCWLDRQVNGGFTADETELEQAAAEFKLSGKTGTAAYIAATYAGYTEQEAQRIGELSNYPARGKHKLVYHHNGAIAEVAA